MPFNIAILLLLRRRRRRRRPTLGRAKRKNELYTVSIILVYSHLKTRHRVSSFSFFVINLVAEGIKSYIYCQWQANLNGNYLSTELKFQN